MKLKINEYELEITAKDTMINDEPIEYGAMDFLNQIAIWASEARDSFSGKGYEGLAEEAGRAVKDINKALKACGYYGGRK